PAYGGLAVSPREILERAPSGLELRQASGAAGIVLGLWLSGVFAASLLARAETQGFEVLLILAASLLWPLLYFMTRGPFLPPSPSRGTQAGLILFSAFSAASVFVSPIIWTSAAYFGMTLIVFMISLQFNSALAPEQYRRGIGLYACLVTALLACYAVRYYHPGVRLGRDALGDDIGIFNPNSIGMLSLSVIAAGFAVKGWLLRMPILAVGTTVLVLTESRSSSLGALIALTVILWARGRHAGTGAKVALLCALLLAAGAAAVYWSTIADAVERFLAVHNSDRGFGTGFTGRLQVWKETWNLFLDHPLVGVGFRAHEVLVTSQSSAHNGYISTLAEIGVVGFAAVIYVIGAGIMRLKRLACEGGHEVAAAVLLAICLGYCFVAIFERYLINVGNPVSLLFMLGILRGAANKGGEAAAREEVEGTGPW
ncbi:MAG TPA: O-antigen ligase family protein, partial [Gammaproteobacteria bacterium]|nr:O-antigen ligase family protein [Gammaproteobacteria bacterium]